MEKTNVPLIVTVNVVHFLLQKMLTENERASSVFEAWVSNFSPKRQSEDPVKPLSSTAPLVAVVLGIWDYSVKTNAFYSSKPEVSITEDENFLDDVEAYEEDLNVLEERMIDSNKNRNCIAFAHKWLSK